MTVTRFLKVQRLNETMNPLMDDMDRCSAEVMAARERGSLDQFWCRTLVRSFFVLVEAFTYELKTMVRAAAVAGAFPVSDDELGALSDVTYDLDAQGRVRSRPHFMPAERHLRFVYRLAVRMVEGSYDLPVSDARFADFKIALSLRNRITHPKMVSDVIVTADELESVRAAIPWYIEAHQELVRLWQHRLAEFIYQSQTRE